MKKDTDTLSLFLSLLTLSLLAAAAYCVFLESSTDKTVFQEHYSISLLVAVTMVLLFQVQILFRRKREPGGTLIFADLDNSGAPEIIYEVPETNVIRFCQEDFKMIYRIEYWPELRGRLLQEKKSDTSEGRLAEKRYQKGNAIASGDFVASLEYMDQSGRQAELSDLAAMPTPADGAIEIIRNNFPKVWVFHTPHELVMWEYELAEHKRPAFRLKVMEFLRKRGKEIG